MSNGLLMQLLQEVRQMRHELKLALNQLQHLARGFLHGSWRPCLKSVLKRLLPIGFKDDLALTASAPFNTASALIGNTTAPMPFKTLSHDQPSKS